MKKALLVTLIGLCATSVSATSFAAEQPLNTNTGTVVFNGNIQEPTVALSIKNPSEAVSLESNSLATINFTSQQKEATFTIAPSSPTDQAVANQLTQFNKKNIHISWTINGDVANTNILENGFSLPRTFYNGLLSLKKTIVKGTSINYTAKLIPIDANKPMFGSFHNIKAKYTVTYS